CWKVALQWPDPCTHTHAMPRLHLRLPSAAPLHLRASVMLRLCACVHRRLRASVAVRSGFCHRTYAPWRLCTLTLPRLLCSRASVAPRFLKEGTFLMTHEVKIMLYKAVIEDLILAEESSHVLLAAITADEAILRCGDDLAAAAAWGFQQLDGSASPPHRRARIHPFMALSWRSHSLAREALSWFPSDLNEAAASWALLQIDNFPHIEGEPVVQPLPRPTVSHNTGRAGPSAAPWLAASPSHSKPSQAPLIRSNPRALQFCPGQTHKETSAPGTARPADIPTHLPDLFGANPEAEVRRWMLRISECSPAAASAQQHVAIWAQVPLLTLGRRLFAKLSLTLPLAHVVRFHLMPRDKVFPLDPGAHRSVDPERFTISANGGPKFNNVEANKVGNYNVLLQGCSSALYDTSCTWEESHETFHHAFAAFPWEVLECFSPPPRVSFSWRHWGHFTGSYEGHQGSGELVEMYGFAVAEVDDQLRLVDVEVYYKADSFLEVMKGLKPATALAQGQDLLGAGGVWGLGFGV
ncbi:unnamed protein product, partial [Symbiodinium microadriaticum]